MDAVVSIISYNPPNLADAGIIVSPPTGVTCTRESITGVSPSVIFSGDIVTVFGVGFTGVFEVDFDSVPSPSFTIVSDTKLTATVPTLTKNSIVTIFIRAKTATCSTAITPNTQLSYDPAPIVPPPDVDSNYITEAGGIDYVAEDGSTFYVPEF